MEIDEASIALRVVESILVAKIDRIGREVLANFKGGRLSQEAVTRLKAEYDAARSLLGSLTEATGGKNGQES